MRAIRPHLRSNWRLKKSPMPIRKSSDQPPRSVVLTFAPQLLHPILSFLDAHPTMPQTPPPAPSSAESPRQVQASADSVKVWVNLSSSVYHCPGSEWYGKTKNGKFMSQADAVAMGARLAYNKP